MKEYFNDEKAEDYEFHNKEVVLVGIVEGLFVNGELGENEERVEDNENDHENVVDFVAENHGYSKPTALDPTNN